MSARTRIGTSSPSSRDSVPESWDAIGHVYRPCQNLGAIGSCRNLKGYKRVDLLQDRRFNDEMESPRWKEVGSWLRVPATSISSAVRAGLDAA